MKWKIKLNRDTLFKKLPQEIKFLQKFKDFYSNKVNSLPKRFFFWIFIVVFFIFILPFFLGGVLVSYIFPRIETKPSWLKLGLVALILIVTFQVGIGWTKNLLGMNTPPNLVISNPTTEETKVKGVNTIEISGKVNPAGSTIKINNSIVAVTEDGNFTKEVSINKGKNEIKIIGKHGSGTTEKTVVVYRELTEEELAEEKRIEEEQRAKAEEKRKAEEEAVDFRVIVDDIYSKCITKEGGVDIINPDFTLWKKYDGKIVEITGTVDRIMDYYKDTVAAKQGVDVSKYIDKNKRYEICLADNQGHACLTWAYSSSPDFIKNIKKGDKITIRGRWDYSDCIPELINSEIKKVF